MKLDYIVKFDVDAKTGKVQYESQRSEFLTNLQFQDIIYVEFIFVQNHRIYNSMHGFFRKAAFTDTSDLYYVNNGVSSRYVYLLGDDTKFDVLQATNAKSQPTGYPYRLIQEHYNASVQPIRFQVPPTETNVSTVEKQLKYTFGIEFETAGGVIPEDLCFSLGLIPLRDGSITGIEYATVPMSNRNINLLREQVNCLREYTATNSTCSMHMHFGRLPNDLKYHYVLYRVFNAIEYTLEQYLPDYTFSTNKYKTNGKNYCGHLPNSLNLFDFYEWISGGVTLDMTDTTFSLKYPHPSDESGNHKWNISQRYYSMNLINALFYNRNKTVEFRFLKPSYNINFIINWLYIFTAILKTAESIYQLNELRSLTLGDCDKLCTKFFAQTRIDLNLCINTAFKDAQVRNTLFTFLSNLTTVTKLQRFVGDNIGLKTQFHDIYFKTNPIDQ